MKFEPRVGVGVDRRGHDGRGGLVHDEGRCRTADARPREQTAPDDRGCLPERIHARRGPWGRLRRDRSGRGCIRLGIRGASLGRSWGIYGGFLRRWRARLSRVQDFALEELRRLIECLRAVERQIARHDDVAHGVVLRVAGVVAR